MQRIPIGGIWLVSAAFVAGVVLQDGLNRQSWLRQNWRHLTRRFDVVASQVVRHVYTNEPRRRLEVNVHIKFTRRVRGGRLILRVLSFAGKDQPPRESPFDLERNVDKERGDVMKFCIYRLPIPYPHWEPWEGGWAPDIENPGRSHPAPDGVVAALELENGWWPTQRHRFYVRTINYRDGKPAEDVFHIDEEWDIFDVEKRLVHG